MSNVVTLHIDSTDGAARAGTLTTPHGEVATPAFMPVATQASVKSLTGDEAAELGAQMVLANTYHLMLRPGADIMAQLGGLHRFMRWPGPILTDSGGYQIYSLAHRVDVTDEAVTFRSHLDGSRHVLSPERAVAVQEALGADIIMVLDHLTAQPAEHAADAAALNRTLQWAARCREAKRRDDQALFGIVQGGLHLDLRERSIRELERIGFPGYGIGGLSVGESKAAMYGMLARLHPVLPQDKPRYLMGVGSPEDLLEAVGCGVDLFDCVLPTRLARHGALFAPTGRVNIRKAAYRTQEAPVDPDCDCPDVPELQRRLPAPPLPQRGVALPPPRHAAQSALYLSPLGGCARGHQGATVCGVHGLLLGSVHTGCRGSARGAATQVASATGRQARLILRDAACSYFSAIPAGALL